MPPSNSSYPQRDKYAIPVVSVDKKYFVFNKGINTEAPLVAWPEGFSIDEQNFDLLSDGSRRRRYGLSKETDGLVTDEEFSGSSSDASATTRTFRWRDAGNVSDRNYLVMQIGTKIHFWLEPSSGAIGQSDFYIDLLSHKVTYTDTFPSPDETYTADDTDVQTQVCDFTQINGKLVIVGTHTEALLVEYDSENDVMTVYEIIPEERDLIGINDGIPFTEEPDTLSDEHKYNLWNCGWLQENIDAFYAAIGRYPSKNMLQYKGLRMQADATYVDQDGIKTFSPEKLEEEIFGSMEAPKGSIIRKVFNWREGLVQIVSGPNTENTMSLIAVSNVNYTTRTLDVTITAAGHTLIANDDVALKNVQLRYYFNTGSAAWQVWKSIDGEYTVSAADATTFTITATIPNNLTWGGSYRLGTWREISSTATLYNPSDDGAPCKTRFSACVSAVGRVFYSGCPDKRQANKVYYSRVVEHDPDLSKCYTQADPTSEFISDPLPSDGGYVVIPEAGYIRGLSVWGPFVIVYASNGVWAIGPGSNGFFSALGYTLIKVTDNGCINPYSIVSAGDVPMYWAEDGVYGIGINPDSNRLEAQNITKDTINGLYNSIPFTEKTRAKGIYDSIRKRVMWLYNSRLTETITATPPLTGENMVQTTPITPIGTIDDTATTDITFDSLLIFDLRLSAWIRWTFGTPASYVFRDFVAMPTSYITDNENRVKVFAQYTAGTGTQLTRYRICEFNSTDYQDLGTEPEAFLMTGPDSLVEPERLRTAPYVHVFMRKQDDSEIYMQPRWDWARGANSGKMGNYMNVYREIKPNPTSYGMIVTKNKIRGRGRNLFLAFKAGDGKDAWLEGWTIKYDAVMRL